MNAVHHPEEPDSSTVVDEHFVPYLGNELGPYIEANDMNAVHHLIHYIWARKTISGLLKNPVGILDVACGAGFGSHMLAEKFPESQITGVDIDAKAVNLARQTYARNNLKYQVGNVMLWSETIGDNEFEAIVSFDTIEHIPHREIMMENLVRHLAGNGILLLTTPCGHRENQLKPPWEHHDIEYCPRSLYDFLKRYFGTILVPHDKDFPGLDVFRRLSGTSIPYLLLCNPVVCLEPVRFESPFENYDLTVAKVSALVPRDMHGIFI